MLEDVGGVSDIAESLGVMSKKKPLKTSDGKTSLSEKFLTSGPVCMEF